MDTDLQHNNSTTRRTSVLWNPYMDYNISTETVSQEDLQELKGMKTRKIVFTKNQGKFKEGDIEDAKTITNKRTSEPPTFLVIEEKIGSPKIGYGGKGSVEFFKFIEQTPVTDTNSNKNAGNSKNDKLKESLFYILVTIGALAFGYFAYNELKK